MTSGGDNPDEEDRMSQKSVNKDATKNAVKLLDYLSETARELYKLMFERYTGKHHLDNLLWVWNSRLSEGYPGDEYVDVISVDVYPEEYRATDYAKEYEELVRNTSDKKVAALAEVGYLPDIDMLAKSHVPWAYFMTWSKEFIIGEKYNSVGNLRRMYSSSYAIQGKGLIK